jgi:hypothetical protein
VELPTSPKTVAELSLVRFWLHQMAKFHFENVSMSDLCGVTFNHEFIEALFPDGQFQGMHFRATQAMHKITLKKI